MIMTKFAFPTLLVVLGQLLATAQAGHLAPFRNQTQTQAGQQPCTTDALNKGVPEILKK